MIGTQLGKTYQIIDKIDEGGMGVVYQVEHQTLHKRFAAKVLASGLAENPEALKRFEIEAHAASKLEHENIVNVTDYGVADDGRPYLVMELLKGKTLYQRLLEGPLSLQESVAVLVPLCHALSAAHAEGFVHRDVKPENIFLTSRPMNRFGIKVLDFGITRLRAENSRLTKLGQALGSPLYMAPETCRGEAIDNRADIYSVGVLMYQLLCGQLPFYDENLLKIIHLQVAQPLRPPRELVPDMSVELDLVIRTALEKDPANRYQTIDELEDDFLAALPPDGDALLHARRTPLSVPVATASTPFPIIESTSGPMAVVESTSGSSLASAPAVVASPVAVHQTEGRSLPRAAITVGALLLGVGVAVVILLFMRGGDDDGKNNAAAAEHRPSAIHGRAASAAPAGDSADPTRRINVTTKPPGASVTLDGTFLGSSPVDVQSPITSGAAALVIEAKGFRPVERSVGGDEDVVLSLALEPAKQPPLKQPPTRRTKQHEPPPPTRPRTPSASKPDDQLEIRGAR
jgi:serine/threonine protein kinase